MRLPALFAMALLSGCTLTTEWRGDPVFLTNRAENHSAQGGPTDETDRIAEWKRGETTMPEVIEFLGPPDELLRQGKDLLLLYRYRYKKAREIRLVAYGGQFFRWFDGKEIDSAVVVAFDSDDTLAYIGRGSYAGDKGIMSFLLDR